MPHFHLSSTPSHPASLCLLPPLLPGVSVSSEQLTAATIGAAMGLPGSKVQSLPAALWNIDRLDQRAPPLDQRYSYGSDSSAGTGVGAAAAVCGG